MQRLQRSVEEEESKWKIKIEESQKELQQVFFLKKSRIHAAILGSWLELLFRFQMLTENILTVFISLEKIQLASQYNNS